MRKARKKSEAIKSCSQSEGKRLGEDCTIGEVNLGVRNKVQNFETR